MTIDQTMVIQTSVASCRFADVPTHPRDAEFIEFDEGNESELAGRRRAVKEEKDLAAHLQSTKGDPDEWGDATPEHQSAEAADASRRKSAPKRRLAAMVSVRLSPEELEAVQARATERGESVSGYLRGVALRDVTSVRWVFRAPAAVSTGEPYVVEVAGSPIISDGGRLPTRAS